MTCRSKISEYRTTAAVPTGEGTIYRTEDGREWHQVPWDTQQRLTQAGGQNGVRLNGRIYSRER